MLTLKQGIKISAIIDKMGLKVNLPEKGESEEDNDKRMEQVGADLTMQAISKLHLAENEVYALVADLKGIPVEDAAEVDILEVIQELFGDIGAVNFIKSAVKSKAQGSLNS